MKFVTVRDFRIRPGNVWKKLEENEEVVITSSGKPIALLTSISDVDFDEKLRILRRTKAELAVSRMRKIAIKRGISNLGRKEIEPEISAVRRTRE
jgi:prevent-host-death family protein